MHPVSPVQIPLPSVGSQQLLSDLNLSGGHDGRSSEMADTAREMMLVGMLQTEADELNTLPNLAREQQQSAANHPDIQEPKFRGEQLLVELEHAWHRQRAMPRHQQRSGPHTVVDASLETTLSPHLGVPRAPLQDPTNSSNEETTRSPESLQANQEANAGETKLPQESSNSLAIGATRTRGRSWSRQDRLRHLKHVRREVPQKLAERLRARSRPSAPGMQGSRPQQVAIRSPRDPLGPSREHSRQAEEESVPVLGGTLGSNTQENSATAAPPAGPIAAGKEIEGVTSAELTELLQWRNRQALARRLATERLLNQNDDEDPPPDPTEQRLLSRASEGAAGPVEAALDFGHGLSLGAEEKKEMHRRVQAELAKIPKVPHFNPTAEGLLFLETFNRPDVFSSWLVSTRRTHPGRYSLPLA